MIRSRRRLSLKKEFQLLREKYKCKGKLRISL